LEIPLAEKSWAIDKDSSATIKLSELAERFGARGKLASKIMQITGTGMDWKVPGSSLEMSNTGMAFKVYLDIYAMRVESMGYNGFPPQLIKDTIPFTQLFGYKRNFITMLGSDFGMSLPSFMSGGKITIGTLGGTCGGSSADFIIPIEATVNTPLDNANALKRSLALKLNQMLYKSYDATDTGFMLPNCQTNMEGTTKLDCPFVNVGYLKPGECTSPSSAEFGGDAAQNSLVASHCGSSTSYLLYGTAVPSKGFLPGGINMLLKDLVHSISQTGTPKLCLPGFAFPISTSATVVLKPSGSEFVTCSADELSSSSGGRQCGVMPFKTSLPASLDCSTCEDSSGSATDTGGDTCYSFRTPRTDQGICTQGYDDDDFQARTMCCSCGGGQRSCTDTSNGAVVDTTESTYAGWQVLGKDCSYFSRHPTMCIRSHRFDTSTFVARTMCCACGGGSTGTAETQAVSSTTVVVEDSEDDEAAAGEAINENPCAAGEPPCAACVNAQNGFDSCPAIRQFLTEDRGTLATTATTAGIGNAAVVDSLNKLGSLAHISDFWKDKDLLGSVLDGDTKDRTELCKCVKSPCTMIKDIASTHTLPDETFQSSVAELCLPAQLPRKGMNVKVGI
jgi:hypothetical protein